MNEKTVKLLKKYSRQTDRPEKEIKRWWVTLTAKERVREKKRMEAELARSTQ